MENKNNVLTAIICLVAGIFVGFLIWGAGTGRTMMSSKQGMHMMPGGSLMGDNGMDMQSMMDSMNAGLKGKQGDDFDKAFISEMIIHHQGAITMAELALTNAKHQEVKTLAKAIISAQTSEIAQMKSWLKNWYSSNQ
jgi:uncharacterized protein (DUF305 family)